MQNAEAMLAEWHRLYLQLQQARAELGRDMLGRDPATHARRLRVARLQEASDQALSAVHAAIAAARSARTTTGTEPRAD